MRVSECSGKRVLPFVVNISRLEERERINQIGSDIASEESLHYEGYSVVTADPYSIESAKVTLYFN